MRNKYKILILPKTNMMKNVQYIFLKLPKFVKIPIKISWIKLLNLDTICI